LLGFTNPNKQQYVVWAKDRIIEESKDNMVGTLVSVFAPSLIDGSTSDTNIMIFSVFTTDFDNKEFVVLGIMNRFIPLHEEIKDKYKNYMKENQIIIPSPPQSNKQTSQRITQTSARIPGSDIFKVNNESGYKTYINGRFGFSISYPQDFKPNKPPANGDGLKCTSQDGQATLTAYGSNNAKFSLQELYNMDIKNIKGELGYKEMGDSWYVITWKENGIIYYKKTFLGAESNNSFTFSFPEDQRTQYNDIVTSLEKSFKPGEINQVW
jgi:hypothetical protein